MFNCFNFIFGQNNPSVVNESYRFKEGEGLTADWPKPLMTPDIVSFYVLPRSQIGRGMVIYVCFFKGATDDILPKMGR